MAFAPKSKDEHLISPVYGIGYKTDNLELILFRRAITDTCISKVKYSIQADRFGSRAEKGSLGS